MTTISGFNSMYRIGQVTEVLGLTADTLRYYEKIGLLPPVHRHNAIRFYSEKDLSRLQFIKRAQKMGFALDEIGDLLTFRENPQTARPQVRQLAQTKLVAIHNRVAELTHLQNELTLLLNLCSTSSDGCPILDTLAGEPSRTDDNE
jgi:MerR family copper efflux transcriptional regulator